MPNLIGVISIVANLEMTVKSSVQIKQQHMGGIFSSIKRLVYITKVQFNDEVMNVRKSYVNISKSYIRLSLLACFTASKL